MTVGGGAAGDPSEKYGEAKAELNNNEDPMLFALETGQRQELDGVSAMFQPGIYRFNHFKSRVGICEVSFGA